MPTSPRGTIPNPTAVDPQRPSERAPIRPPTDLVTTAATVRTTASTGVRTVHSRLGDGRFSSLNHQGIATDGYRPGRYAVEEKLVEDFKQFYVDRSRAALEGLAG